MPSIQPILTIRLFPANVGINNTLDLTLEPFVA
jgi:hypothetical protein